MGLRLAANHLTAFVIFLAAIMSTEDNSWAGSVAQNAGNPAMACETCEFEKLSPGAGFNSLFNDPEPMGAATDSGSDAKAIARWNVVPYQSFDRDFHIGVVAFHMNGIDRVEFSLDGGKWLAVKEMNFNPRSGTWEYVVTIPIDAVSEGLREIRAIAYPNVGIPRLLQGEVDGSQEYANGNHSMFLYASPNGVRNDHIAYCAPYGSDETGTGTKDNPFRQPSAAALFLTKARGTADGGFILLLPGEYSFGPPSYPYPLTTDRWLTIQPAPGVSRDEVLISDDGPSGIGTRLVRLNNLTIKGQVRLAQNKSSFIWIDNSFIDGVDRTIDTTILSGAWWGGIYVTNSDATRSKNAIRAAGFIRNSYVYNISGVPFGGVFTVNSRTDTYNNEGTEFHGDVFHWMANDLHENVIIYGVKASNFVNQGVFAEVVRGKRILNNVALVNVLISKDAEDPTGSWWNTETNHLLLWHVSFPDQQFRWKQKFFGSNSRNISIRGSIFSSFSGYDDPGDYENAEISDNHFISVYSYKTFATGIRYTTGNAGFVDAKNADYKLKSDSPLLSRLTESLIPHDLTNTKCSLPRAVGPYCGYME